MASFTTTSPAPPTSTDAAAREMLRILPLLHHTVSALSLMSHEVRDLRPALQDHQDATVAELCQRLALTIKRMTPPQGDAPTAKGGTEGIAVIRQAVAAGRFRIRCKDRGESADTDGGMVWPIEIELSCINGLSCWFTIGNLYSPDAAAQGYTDGALSDDLARAFADHITGSLASPPQPAGTAGGGSGDLGALSAACTPWEFCAGDPPDYDSPLRQVFVAGMLYSEKLLAGFLDVETYEPGDGSEDFDQDATKSLENILTAAGLYDPEEGRKATLAPTPDLGAQGEPVATVHTAPLGTLAPAIGGGRWCKTENGWKWNGPDGTGGTFPRPGADWTGKLVLPAPAAPRTGSGVWVEEIEAVLWKADNPGETDVGWSEWVAYAAKHGNPACFTKEIEANRRRARALRALFAQAPRDGGA